MNLIKKWTSLSTLWKVLTIAIPAVIIIGVLILIIVLNSGLTATTMRLLRIEGTVTLEDSEGAQRSVVESMRFDSGDAISTGTSSLASIQLDDHKVVTLDENSRAEFTKSHNLLELNLTSGGLFFDVNQPLAEDESFDIRTATMTVGIRGTSGYISVDSDGIATLILTSGHVHITGINPTTGETKQLDVNPGQSVRVYLFNDRAVGSVDFFLEDITEEMLNQFILDRLAENDTLRLTVCAASGWSSDLILELGGYSVEVEETEETEESETSASATGTPTPSPEATATPTATPAPAGDNGGGNTAATPTPTPEAGATATPTPRPSNTPTPTPSPTPTQAPSGNGGSSSETSGTTTTSATTTSEPTSTSATAPRPTSTTPTRPTSTTPTNTEPTASGSSGSTESEASGATGETGGETGGGESGATGETGSGESGSSDEPGQTDPPGNEDSDSNGGTNPGYVG